MSSARERLAVLLRPHTSVPYAYSEVRAIVEACAAVADVAHHTYDGQGVPVETLSGGAIRAALKEAERGE